MRILSQLVQSPPVLLIAERFLAVPAFSGLDLPLDMLAPEFGGWIDVVLTSCRSGEHRRLGFAVAAPRPNRLRLDFPGFGNESAEMFRLVVARNADATSAERLQQLAGEQERAPITVRSFNHALKLMPADALVADFGAYWRDQQGVYLEGWTHCRARQIRRLFLCGGDQRVELALSPRPDVLPHYPECGAAMPVGWAGHLALDADTPLLLRAETDQGVVEMPVVLPPGMGVHDAGPDPLAAIARRFVDAVNDGGLDVVEIGARTVSPGENADWRALMSGARSFLGFDVHPSPSVDMVGDAHFLSSLLAPGSRNAIFSTAVLEHCLMPWLIAAEINRVLPIGGLTFHIVPHTWPLHEMPMDFYRFSDVGVATLFGPRFGFEVLDAAMADTMWVHPASRYPGVLNMPLCPGYGRAAVLSRKVAELPPSLGLEAMQRAMVGESGAAYPELDAAQRLRQDTTG